MTTPNPTPPAKKRLITRIHQDFPNISEKQLNKTLHGILRFTNLIRKIRTEPQAEIFIKESRKKGKLVRTRVTNFDYDEFLKVKGDAPIGILEAFRKATSYYPVKKYARKKSNKR